MKLEFKPEDFLDESRFPMVRVESAVARANAKLEEWLKEAPVMKEMIFKSEFFKSHRCPPLGELDDRAYKRLAEAVNWQVQQWLGKAPVILLEKDFFTECHDHGFHFFGFSSCKKRGSHKAPLVCIEEIKPDAHLVCIEEIK